MTNNAEIKSEYSRLRSIMLKRVGRALEQKPNSKTLQKEQATIKQHNIRDYFNKLTEKQQKRALEALQRKTENDRLRVQRKKPTSKAKSDLQTQAQLYSQARTNILNRIKTLKNKPYAIERYLARAERYLKQNTPSEFKKLNSDERYNKTLTLWQMNQDPLLTDKGMRAVVDRQKEILKRNGYEGGENWREEWKSLQQRKKEERQSLGDFDINEENMEFWYHSGSVTSNAMMEEHNRRLGYI